MTRNALLVLGLGLLLVIAGCNGLQSPESTTHSPTLQPTATVAPGSTSTASVGTSSTTTGSSLPGFTAGEVSGPFTLASAHGNVLQNQSYTVTESSSIRYSNGTVVTEERITATIGPTDSRYVYRRTVNGTTPALFGRANGTMVQYANGSVVFRKAIVDGTVAERGIVTDGNQEPVPPNAVYHRSKTNRIGTVFTRLSIVSVTQINDTTFRIEATEFDTDTLRVDSQQIRDVSLDSFSATVTVDGFVRTYEYRFQGTVNGNTVTVTERVRYGEVGTATVDPPSWYEAPNRTPALLGHRWLN
jgi:hypothetical protein